MNVSCRWKISSGNSPKSRAFRFPVTAAIPAPQGVVTVSLGTAVQVPGMRETLPELFQCAGEALYRFKQSGRSRATVWNLENQKSESMPLKGG